MLAKITDNKYIYLDQVTEGAETAIISWFSVRDPSFYVSGAADDEEREWDGVYRRYNVSRQRLWLPFLNELIKCCKHNNIPLDIEDTRPAPKYPVPQQDQITETFLENITLEDYQVRALHAACKHEIGLIAAKTGAGKCLGKDTPVMMFDGSVKMVQDIEVGDLLMGDDSTPREVLSLACGTEPLYRVRQIYGDDYVVNESHILSLKRTRRNKDDQSKGDIEDISVRDYLATNKTFKHLTKGYKAPADFGKEDTPFDPYLLGLWLGDGISADLQICVGIIDYLKRLCREIGLQLVKYEDKTEAADNYALRLYKGVRSPDWYVPFQENKLKKAFRELGLIKNKHVPDVFKKSSREDRLRLLAGFVDAEGEVDHNVITIVHRRGKIIDDITLIARSLGFRASTAETVKECTTTGYKGTYTRLVISGHTDTIPTVLPRKQMTPRKIPKDPLVYGIELEPLGEGPYFGFKIDGNRRFLLGDFTVTHNTEVMCGMVKMFRCPTLIVTEQIVVLEQIVERLKLRNVVHKNDIGMFCFGQMPDDNLVIVGSIQSISTPKEVKRKNIKMSGKRILSMSMGWVAKEAERRKEGRELAEGEVPHLERALPKTVVDKLVEDEDKIHKLSGEHMQLLVDYCNGLEFNKRKKWYKTRLKKAKAIQKLIKGRCDLMLVDEADLATTQQYARLFKFHFNGRRRYGFSGTPFDKDKPVQNLLLREHLGSVIAEAKREEVEEAGRIVPISFYMVVVGRDGDRQDGRAYDIALKEEMVENEAFHRLVAKVAMNYPDEGTLILVDTQPIGPIGEGLEKLIPDSKFIYGKTRPKKRNEVLGQFERRELKCLIGSKILKRGLDLEGGAENLIIVSSGSKWSDFEQKLGRALRLNKRGKARVFGFFFLNNKYLYKHSRENLKAAVSLGYSAKVLIGGTAIDGKKFIKSRFRIPRGL